MFDIRIRITIFVLAGLLMVVGCSNENSVVDPDDNFLLKPLFKISGDVLFETNSNTLKDSLDNPLIVLLWTERGGSGVMYPAVATPTKLEVIFPLTFNVELLDVPSKSLTDQVGYYQNGETTSEDRFGVTNIVLINDTNNNGEFDGDPKMLQDMFVNLFSYAVLDSNYTSVDSIDFANDWFAGAAYSHQVEFISSENALKAWQSYPQPEQSYDTASLQTGYNLMKIVEDEKNVLGYRTFRVDETKESVTITTLAF